MLWLKKDIDYELLDEIRAIEKDIRGIKHEVEQQRTYPKGTLAAQVIGHINDQNMGEGIEYQYKQLPFKCETATSSETGRSLPGMNP